MAKDNKLAKSKWPTGHSANDFNCFGPPAVADGEFSNTMLCDMGCFKQGDVDTNKYYHGAVVQSKKDQSWYAYFEYGRTGQPNPQFQFIKCSSQSEAKSEYEKQMHVKNDRRGEWVNKPGLGKVLQAKKDKDCYLVRPQATRSTGLSDARTIVHGVVKIQNKTTTTRFDSHSEQLLKDLNLATTNYTRSSMVNDAIPTSEAINRARVILDEATKLANNLTSPAAILASNDLGDLTSMIYSLVPKKKNRNDEKDVWWLTPHNISMWRSDLDAFEQALNATQGVVVSDMPFGLSHMDGGNPHRPKLEQWVQKASRNVHSNVRGMKIHNMWKVERNTLPRFVSCQKRIVSDGPDVKEKPLHQVPRFDLDNDADFRASGTYMLFHGTRTVNVTGILTSGLRLPSHISNVAISGAMFGGGLYFADDWKKSAGYCSCSGSYWSGGGGSIKGRQAFMFICDVIIGKPFVAPGPKGYTAPPKGHHSIFGKSGASGVANNEFIVFDIDQHNLRYLIEFQKG